MLQEFSVEIYFRQYWRDDRLRLDQFNIAEPGPLFLNPQMISQIWIPSAYFHSSKNAALHVITMENVLMKISPGGDVFYSQR